MATPSATTGNVQQPVEPIPAPSAAPLSQPVPQQPATTTSAKAPPGFKFVKVKKPDGSIVTVKRKLTAEETSAAAAVPATEAPSASKASPPGENFKIVTVRQPDGSLIKVRRAVDKDQDVTPPVVSGKAAADGPAQNTASITSTTEPKPSDTNKDASAVTSIKAKDTPTVPSQKPAVATAARDTDRETPAAQGKPPAAPGATAAEPVTYQDALDEQKDFNRQRKRHAFKTRLLRGVAVVAGAAVPAIEIGDLMDGDEVLSDDDWSVDEDDGNDDHDDMSDAGQDLHHGAEDEHIHATDDDDKTLENGADSAGNITIDAGGAIQGAGMAMAAAGSQPPPRQPPPVTGAAPGDKKDAEKEKVTYKITAKDLNQMEDTTTEKATRPLKKHWANMTFYIMASLSIVLPLLFLLLGLFIILMKGKSITSHWGSMQDVIKVAISAWPIVFAAVVAQVFKAWATYKVERGIKLMELEQLIGSNSFGSAIKQPFLLRRLDLLTLLLLVVWCLSPLGSQALQRTFTIGPALVNTTMPVLYLDMTVNNRFFSETNMGMLAHAQTLNDVMQKMSNFYLSTFLPPGAYEYDWEDSYNHPKPIWLDSNKPIDDAPFTTSHYGVPLILTKSIFSNHDVPTSAPGDGNIRFERVTFQMTSSYFDFQCGDWSVVDGTYFNDTTKLPEGVSWGASLSETAHYAFYSDGADQFTSPINRMRFGSLIRNGSTAVVGGSAQPTSGNESFHSLIDCSFKQIFVDFPVDCYQDENSLTGVPDCTYDSGSNSDGGWAVHETPPGNLKNTSGANLISGTGQTFAQNTAPFLANQDPVTTPNEIYLAFYTAADKFDKFTFNLSRVSTPELFGRRISYLFNTWMDLGNSVDYLTYTNETDIKPGQEGEFIKVAATHVYTDGKVYFISIGWVIGYFLCAAMLLIAGAVSVVVESMTVAPDILGYVSTVARNSKYLQLPKTNSAMNGGERARVLGGTKVMMQDVKAKADVGRIALGLKHENAQPLRSGRLYR